MNVAKVVGRFARKNPPAAVSAVVLMGLIMVAINAPLLAAYDPYQSVGARLRPPGGEFAMGTDQLGRDLASRVIYGSRITLYVSLLSVSVSLLLGAIWGITAAYFKGVWDLFTQRLVDVAGAFPSIVLALALMSALGASLNNVVIALVFVFTFQMARIIRSSALAVVERPYVEAAQAIGASNLRLLVRHIAPNTLGTVVVLFSINLGAAAIYEASLSFLGAGANPADPSWGGMMTKAASTVALVAPWIAIAPGVALSLTVMSFNLIGDAVRDEIDPKLRGR
jgi:peptide/nickel transport system permease protein